MHRRHFLGSTAASVFFAGFPVTGYTKDLPYGNLVLIILEGGMDGLTAVPPIGDPSLVKQRKRLVTSAPLNLNPFFSLHPNLRNFAGMLANNEAAIVHAAAFPYTARSHFEGQNIVESGVPVPFSLKTGWLGRAMDEARIAGRAFALDTPLVIRGAKEVDSFYPAHIGESRNPDSRILELLSNSHGGLVGDALKKLNDTSGMRANQPRVRDPEGLALNAGRAMRDPDGPRVAVIRIPEFDTHANQGTDDGLHPELLAILDNVFLNLKKGLRSSWESSIVLTATEFGRTVKENGSAGTDHGYGSVGLLAGGLLKRSKIVANWPGLASGDLFEGRDLYSTMDYRSVCAACIEAAFGLDHGVIAEKVFIEPSLERTFDFVFG